jgi:CheY-like chemotaxis protein
MLRVLVLDDEALISMMLQDWLNELGCEIVGPANSPQSALALLDATPPDAALLDLSLGQGNSYAVAAALRDRQVPFAFITGYGKTGIAADFQDEPIVPKPFDFDEIKKVIAELLDGKAAGSKGPRDGRNG